MKPNHHHSQSSTANPRRPRRPDLTLPLPQRNPSLAVPLPLPPSSAPTTSSSSTSPWAAYHYHHHPSSAPSSTYSTASYLHPSPPLSDLDRVRRIGSGNGGTVWMVHHRPTNQTYALKVIYAQHEDSIRRRICREIEILRTADNPFVVRCHGLYDEGGQIQVLLEYMDGGSLAGKHIASEPILAGIAKQILQGLVYLHNKKIVHRDIKPSNLLVDAAMRVKISDFGVSAILSQTMDPCNSSVGTIAYMSPERINTNTNHGSYDGYAADIWSFGLSILEFYQGRFPVGEKKVWNGNDLASLMCAICYSDPPQAPAMASAEFRSFISCCLQKEPSKRLTAAQLLLHPFITHTAAIGAGRAANGSPSPRPIFPIN